MKSFLSLTLLICLAFVSMAQVASGPPIDKEPTKLTMEAPVFRTLTASDIYITPAAVTMEYRQSGEISIGTGFQDGVLSIGDGASVKGSKDISISGSPITTAGTLSLRLDDGTVVYSNGNILLPERSKHYQSANLTYAHTYNWNPGYVGWQK